MKNEFKATASALVQSANDIFERAMEKLGSAASQWRTYLAANPQLCFLALEGKLPTFATFQGQALRLAL
ncbi:MAG TPA: hypothetical protein VFR09_08030 [Alphaproteobacteria bacterium]|nr:hypothetical protein [Alphaproteobacteria bacterium]